MPFAEIGVKGVKELSSCHESAGRAEELCEESR